MNIIFFELLVSDSDTDRNKVMRSEEDTESDNQTFENLGLGHAFEHGFGKEKVILRADRFELFRDF